MANVACLWPSHVELVTARGRDPRGPPVPLQSRSLPWTSSNAWISRSNVGVASLLCGLWAGLRRSEPRVARLAEEGQQQEYLEEFDALGRELTGKAIIVGWDPGRKNRVASPDGPSFSPEESMEELEGLCKTLGLEVKECVLQQWRPTQGRLPIGSGKAEELRQQVKYDPEIGVVVFDQDMSYRMLMTLKGRIAPNGECVILDRTSLILRIFAQRARTKEAKLQVKLASQRYMLPRLRYYLTTGAGMEAQGGSVGAGGSASGGGAYLKGKGETQLQMDRTLLKRRIAACTKQLEEVRKVRARQRERHVELGLPIISLVGYTNAGKSTLMNALAQSTEVKTKDRLFETLDPTRRSVTLPGGRTVMLADTVGFIQRLPEQLVAGFRATLEEVVETTMILHVVDVSSPTAAQQIASVLKTLKRLPKFKPDTPQIMVYNKVDKLEGGIAEELEQSLSYPHPGIVGHVQISALKGTGFHALAEAIEDTLIKHTDYGAAQLRLLIPYTDSSIYAQMKSGDQQVKINTEEHTSDGYLLRVTASPTAARILKDFEVSEEDFELLTELPA
ncbi:GTPase HflX (GTP-binding protein HflX) [Durusdinium trenchii]|uniref:GTPase HflX (GTP-binding protein HflX) n=1 Tax=Durusdinium trenchii TaxID=1381693 RepID=A0ABP0JMW9_9DINO